ncbi:MAG: tRNA 4-thiouridine(8) synthase ThiI [Proteobacteria bacterium]|nr:tRNA 4-thiouridine(8) synthase ThiI [Pseudomonadota bacterium]
MQFIVIRYSELGLKGKNRNWFENLLMSNIRKHLFKLGTVRVSKIHGRIIVESEGDADRTKTVLQNIPGIANFSIAFPSTHEMEDIAAHALNLMQTHIDERNQSTTTFKVDSRRSDKSFPLNSPQLSAQIGADILRQYPDLKVDLSKPDIELGIEIWPKSRSILYLRKHAGQGGLPSGSSGTVISFISGGIDSPVASWFMMKRGCVPVFLHFHSYPFVGEQSRQKVVDLVTHLSRYQPESTLVVVQFSEIQKAIKANCSEKNRTILYRRMMYRVAEKLKNQYKALAYVTGEAVGQVASQTLENLTCTQDVTTVPVLRPLIGMEKAEIIEWAKKIGTYPISIQPFPDCCTVFQPRKPEIHGQLGNIEKDETHLDIEGLVSATLENIETLTFETQVQDKFWE